MSAVKVDDRECLNCGETKASIKRNRISLCGIVGGYEYRELGDEFPRHRWADWNDAELARLGVKPEAFDRHRRTRTLTFQWIACDDTVRGHIPATAELVGTWVDRVGQCINCGRDPEPGGSENG